MLAVLLGTAVFMWGLGYKLSLYQSVAVHHAEPAARLLSQKERPAPVVPLEGLFRSSKAPHRAAPHTLSPTDLAQLDHGHLDVAGAPLDLSRPSTPLPQQPQRITGSSPRAPPIGA